MRLHKCVVAKHHVVSIDDQLLLAMSPSQPGQRVGQDRPAKAPAKARYRVRRRILRIGPAHDYSALNPSQRPGESLQRLAVRSRAPAMDPYVGLAIVVDGS